MLAVLLSTLFDLVDAKWIPKEARIFLGGVIADLARTSTEVSQAVQDHYDAGKLQLILEGVLLSFVLYVLFKRPAKSEKPLSKKEMDQLIAEWEPEPMHPVLSDRELKLDAKVPVITSTTSTHVTIKGGSKPVLNLARTNFLGMIGNKRIEETAVSTVQKYGVGTCGPRGFYGTLDVHLELEKRITDFVGHDDCLIYSYGFATVSSTIPAFAGRGDLIICDSGVNFATQTGVKLSRSEVMYFKHNDMADLERILKSVQDKDKRSRRPLNRRFIVIEGVYLNYGDIAPLPEILALKHKYCYRVIMDDSYGIGSIGKTGRGTCEYHNVKPQDIDFITGMLSATTSSVGGFCCGKKDIIYHQRLNSTGYVYSASLPALLATSAKVAFDILDENPALVQKLAQNTKAFHEGLNNLPGLNLIGQAEVPVFHLRLNTEILGKIKERLAQEELLQEIVDEALAKGVFTTRARYTIDHEEFPPPASIKIYSSAVFTKAQIEEAVKVLREAVATVLLRQSLITKAQADAVSGSPRVTKKGSKAEEEEEEEKPEAEAEEQEEDAQSSPSSPSKKKATKRKKAAAKKQ